MKRIFLIASLFASTLAVQAQEKKADDVIKMNKEKIDFGKIKQNVPVTTFFEITNISDKPIVIENAWAGCGCTTPEVPKEPIAPKATVKLKVGYNAAALHGFEKEVNVKLAGINEPKVVKIVGEVLDADAYDAYVKANKKGTDNAKPKTTTKKASK